MRILVTGARGLLGRSLLAVPHDDIDFVGGARQPGHIADIPLVAVDLKRPQTLVDAVTQTRPDAVIHTAALTNVDECERSPDFAQQVNEEAVRVLAEHCAAVDIAMVHLSTDYVFDGQAGPYAETDTPRPLSRYGQIKLDSESPVLALDRGIVVRTLWLYGHFDGARRNLVTWPIESLAKGEILRIVDDQWGNPTCAPDLAAGLLELLRASATGLFHFGGETFLTRLELVQRIADYFGLDASRVEPMKTAQAGQDAPRPLRSGLRSDRARQTIGRAPLSLEAGLDRLATQAHFRQDFGALLGLG
ncbi:MAG: dTDP-4-dehydrorhamnose reductase [Candidatus Latescibacterota bacterium]|nr:dTDP-4-dehydrorhamnose reductase [Candidatus Latescibacterota bacterium]MEC8933023.1 dTDP-4-dehydrorhamnose reductase [Candidatus Latescibacterota bacterium]MEC9377612.1 dTDP-4-dehydrorhamnose reductase [Candidatus Latescibacterota bacterium]MEE3261810.1 dTDP-4-dehydrorhamnose reductase [Candidatus Latescibacterota bacterium]